MKPRICVVDYKVGNRFSILAGLRRAGGDAVLISSESKAKDCDGFVLPGVGSYPAAMRVLEQGLGDIILESVKAGIPVLGVCLGMQLMFEESLEWGRHRGLALLPGVVKPMPVWRKPHIGWSKVYPVPGSGSRLLRGLEYGSMFYYAHSLYVETQSEIVKAYSVYRGFRFPAIVEKHPLYGTQFHPEKSSSKGIRLLRNWVYIVEEAARK